MTTAAVHRWSDLPSDSPMALLSRRRIVGANVMISQITLEEGCAVPTHAHENEQIACVMSGTMRFGVGAEDDPDRYEVTVNAGEVLHLPSWVPHSATAIETSVVLDVFSPTSEGTGIDAHNR